MNCGSEKGWFQHKAANTPPCQFCAPYNPKLAQPKKQAVVVAVRKKPGPKPKRKLPDREAGKFTASPEPAVCGTHSGYKKHRKNGEEACRPCKDAAAAYARERYALKPPKEIKHGTETGVTQHRRRGIPLCDPCRETRNESNRRQYHAKKAEKQ